MHPDEFRTPRMAAPNDVRLASEGDGFLAPPPADEVLVIQQTGTFIEPPVVAKDDPPPIQPRPGQMPNRWAEATTPRP